VISNSPISSAGLARARPGALRAAPATSIASATVDISLPPCNVRRIVGIFLAATVMIHAGFTAR
jgi:hypothetical protein